MAAGQGFASLTPEQRAQVAGEGGRAAHAQGRAHVWTPEDAREAGRRGGMASAAARKARQERRSLEAFAEQSDAGAAIIEKDRLTHG